MQLNELIEDANDPCARPKAAAVVQGVRHEIERPGLVEARGCDEGLAEARGDTPARAPRQIEPQGTKGSIAIFP